MLEVYFGILVCISGCQSGSEIIGKDEYFNLSSCEHDQKLIAQAMYVKTGHKYGYRCQKVDYDPPKIGN